MMAVDQIARMMAMDAAQQGGTTDAYTKAETDALLDGKADLVDGKVPASQLPSYVDDVVEYASTSSFPATGESGKIYIATDTNKTYRWGGSAYVEISESLALGETSSTAYAGNKGKANADAIAAIKDGTNIDSFADVETALANIPQVTVDQTYSASSTNAQSGTAVAEAIAKKPGEITTGKQYTIDGQTVTAGTGAEIFNDYSNNKASGQYSHAEGLSTAASGDVSHSEGLSTAAPGDVSHAEGSHTTASGSNSHAEGSYTTASGSNSHAEGRSTKAGSQYQHVQGKFNVEDSSDTYAFIIGNGTSDRARHNAFAIDWNGLIYVNGAATGVDVSQLTPVTVDQTYNAQSVNPQSGAAVAQAVAAIPSVTVDQTYDPSSSNAQSGAALSQTYAQPVKFFTTTITSGQTNKKLSDFGVGTNLPTPGTLCLVRASFITTVSGVATIFTAFTIVPVSQISYPNKNIYSSPSSTNYIEFFSDLGNSASTSTYYMSGVCVYLKADKSLNLYMQAQVAANTQVVVMPIGLGGYLQ